MSKEKGSEGGVIAMNEQMLNGNKLNHENTSKHSNKRSEGLQLN